MAAASIFFVLYLCSACSTYEYPTQSSFIFVFFTNSPLFSFHLSIILYFLHFFPSPHLRESILVVCWWVEGWSPLTFFSILFCSCAKPIFELVMILNSRDCTKATRHLFYNILIRRTSTIDQFSLFHCDVLGKAISFALLLGWVLCDCTHPVGTWTLTLPRSLIRSTIERFFLFLENSYFLRCPVFVRLFCDCTNPEGT